MLTNKRWDAWFDSLGRILKRTRVNVQEIREQFIAIYCRQEFHDSKFYKYLGCRADDFKLPKFRSKIIWRIADGVVKIKHEGKWVD